MDKHLEKQRQVKDREGSLRDLITCLRSQAEWPWKRSPSRTVSLAASLSRCLVASNIIAPR